VNPKDAKPKKKTVEQLRDVWPDILALVRPRWKILLGGMILMVINRVSGLVLPYSTKFLIDEVLSQRKQEMLLPLLAAVVSATLVQGATSFSLTQLLSKAAQRLIAEMRAKVQVHMGRLSISYFDANKSGVMVSRIMNDVEGVRNLIGTGLVEFVGGLLTAALSLVILLSISPKITMMALVIIVAFTAILQNAFKSIRPIFKERGKITGEVTGRLTESLGGVRVVKAAGQHFAIDECNCSDEPFVVTAVGNRRCGSDVLWRATDFFRCADSGWIRFIHDLSGFFDRSCIPNRGYRYATHRSDRRAGAHA